MEPTEIHEFAEQMEKGGEAALTHISLAISVLAVLVAMVTVLGHRTHTEAILLQSRAGDQWNQYQAKKIRQVQSSNTVDILESQPNAGSEAVQKKIEEHRTHIQKWNEDLKDEQEKAEALEKQVEGAEHRASRYDLGEALLQIAVVLASITLLTRTKSYFFFGLLLGFLGLLWAGSALFMH
jgi:gas vesicle protein